MRELEQWGLDASLAKALLRIYEEQHAMSILERRRLHGTLTSAAADEPMLAQDNDCEFFADDYITYHLEAA